MGSATAMATGRAMAGPASPGTGDQPAAIPALRCEQCGHTHPPGNYFCLACGAALDGATAATAARAMAALTTTGRSATAPRRSSSGLRRWGESLTVTLFVLSLLVGLFGPPLEADQWRPEALRARYFGGRLPGDLPEAVAGGSLSLPPAPFAIVRPAAPPGYGPVTVWPALPASAAGYIWATPGWITQEYGCTGFALEPWSASHRCRFHHGIDVGNLPGTVVVAARAGTVAWAGWKDDGYGYSVVVDHGEGVATRYGHFCCPPLVKVGQQVKQGDPLGKMGSTGASSGSHLHFAVEIDGRDVDPRAVLPAER